jgi:hypothetical protein
LYLKDAGAECAAYIKGCTPGPRFTDQAKADALQQLVAAVSFHHSVPTIEFSGVNVQIDSGSGATDGSVNGSGNLIIGYNEGYCHGSGESCTTTCSAANVCVQPGGYCAISHDPCGADADCIFCDLSGKTGSHNLIIGDRATFTSFGGVVVGYENAITGARASVVGGRTNTASGEMSCVTGGQANVASGLVSSVSGGTDNHASGYYASVSGGQGNAANVDGGSVSGGLSNVASGWVASVSGGQCNRAGPGPALCAGAPSPGAAAAVSGGFSNVANGDAASVSGGVSNTASGVIASVSGGGTNSASGTASSVSGGAFVGAGTTFEWHSGKTSGFPSGNQY